MCGFGKGFGFMDTSACGRDGGTVDGTGWVGADAPMFRALVLDFKGILMLLLRISLSVLNPKP
jgi:hypothetical protein